MRTEHIEYLARAASVLALLAVSHRLDIAGRLDRWLAGHVANDWLRAIVVAVPWLACVQLLAPRLLAPAAAAIVAVRLASRAWLALWAAAIVAISLAAIVMPLYQRAQATPLPPHVAARFLAVAAHSGVDVPIERVRQVQADHVDGYMIGAAHARTILFTEAAIDRLPPDEQMFLFAHELGHWTVATRWGLPALLAAVLGAFLLLRALRRLRDGRRSNHRLPFIVLVACVLQLVVEPVRTVVQRQFEIHADEFGVRAITGLVDDPGDTAERSLRSMMRSFGPEPYPEPSPLDVLCGVDHPPLDERIARVRRVAR